MEVHHHPDLHHRKKRWKEYFLEFLMIFLAVTLGFFAESLRENISNSAREKVYVTSFNNDLKQDTLILTTNIQFLHTRIGQLDSFIMLLNKNERDSNEMNSMYYFARLATRKLVFQSTDRTYIELKNSGGFSLLKNKSLSDSIVDYEKLIDDYTRNSANDIIERGNLYPFISKIFDANVFQSMVHNDRTIYRPVGTHSLRDTDSDYINQFIYYLHQLKSSLIIEKTLLIQLRKNAQSIITLIQKDKR